MNLKKVILSDASTEAKVSAIAILLDKELPKLAEKVDTVKKLKGDQGERGVKGDKGDKGSDGKDGKDGRNGTDGSSGKNGKDGKDGVSVIDAKIDFDGSLVMKLSSNKEINVGEVVPSNLQEKIKLVTSGGAGTVLPNQAGNSGKVLGTDGTTLSWVAGGGGGGGSGTVTSVAATVPTGLSVGGSPITTSGTLAITYAAGYSIPTTSSQTNWDTAYTDRLKWDGGSTGLNAATGRTSLGLVIGTDVLAPNGSAANLTSFPIFNQNTTGTAANVTGTVAIANGGTGATSASAALTNLGAYAANNPSGYTSNTGTVTSVSTSGTVNGITLSGGPITSTGTVTLGGTLDLSSPPAIGGTTASTGRFTTVTSTIATGTAPFTVASTTQVANLQAATAGSAATLTTSRSIYGSSFNGSTDLTGVIASTYGGTGNGFTKFSGATTAERTYTLPDATTTILTTNAAVTIAQGGTGQTGKTAAFDALSPLTTKGDLIVSDGTDNIRLPVGTNTHVLTVDSTQASGLKWAAVGGGGGSGSAAANAGIAINENVYSTTYNTLISDSLTVPNAVGGIAAGTTASSLKSKNIVEIIDDLLFPTVLPTYTIPAIASFTASQSGLKEIGSTISQALSQTHNKNDAGAYTSLVFKRGATTLNTVSSPTGTSITNIAAQFGYADPNNPNLSYSSSFTDSGYVVPAGSTTWTAEGTYGAGSAKQNNKGATDSRSAAVRSVNAPQAASTLVSSGQSITGIYPYFWGVSTGQPTASDIATAIQNGTTNKVLADASNNIAITYAASGQYVWFVTVATAASKLFWYNTALNKGSIGAGQFILAPVTQNVTSPQAFWSAVSFKVYISRFATTTSGSITFSVVEQ